MEPFSIHCTTCKTRLKVRDASAIGQILACPKCGGLVMVKEPPPPGSLPSDSAETRPDISTVRPVAPYRPGDTLPVGDFDDIDAILSGAPPRPRDPVPASPKKARVSINDSTGQGEVTLGNKSAVRKSAAPPSADAKDAAPRAESGSSSAVLPSALPQGGSSLVSGKSGKSSLTAQGSSIHGVSKPAAAPIAGSGFEEGSDVSGASGIAASAAPPSATPGIGDPAPYPFAGENPPPAPVIEAKRAWWHWPLLIGSIAAGVLLATTVVLVSFWMLNAENNEPIARNVPPASVETPKDEPPPAENPEATADAAEPSAVQPETEPAAEAPAPMAAVAANAVEADTPPAGELADAAPNAPPAAAEDTADPLGIVQAPKPAGEERPAESKIGDPLGKFGSLVESPPVDPIPVDQGSGAPAIDLPPEMADEGTDASPALPRPQPRRVDVTARLADQLPALEVNSVPLVDYLRFVQDLSTIPVTLQPDSLWFARASAVAPVNVKGENISVGDALARSLKPLGLEYTIVDGQLMVALVEPTPLPRIQYPVKDLTAGDEQRAEELAEWMRTLVQPQSWGEGLGTLTVGKEAIVTHQRRDVHAQLLAMFEKLRIARGASPLSRFDRENFQLEPRYERAKAKLETPISLNFSQPTLLTKIVDGIEDAAQVTILIDWESLAPLGWNPDGEATLLAENQPLADALTRLTVPMDLTWRAIDGKTIQILSPQALQERLELEFYPLGDLAGADEGESLLAQLRSTLGEELFRDAGGRCDLRYDPESKHLLASLPQPLQKKLAVALAGLKAKN